jgi:hypothetical protein
LISLSVDWRLSEGHQRGAYRVTSANMSWAAIRHPDVYDKNGGPFSVRELVVLPLFAAHCLIQSYLQIQKSPKPRFLGCDLL